jgi:hypothetical protein
MFESIRSVRPSWVAFGWFVAVAITSLVLLAMDAFGMMGGDEQTESLWVAVSLVVGFTGAGFLVGTRVVAAPVLHGVAIGMFSVLAWVAINLFVGEPTGEAAWRDLDARTLSGLLVLQAVAAVVGTRLGVRWRRKPVAPIA